MYVFAQNIIQLYQDRSGSVGSGAGATSGVQQTDEMLIRVALASRW